LSVCGSVCRYIASDMTAARHLRGRIERCDGVAVLKGIQQPGSVADVLDGCRPARPGSGS